MGGKTSQRKGSAGERELAAILRQYGHNCDRGGSLTFGEVADITGLPGIHIEVKRVEKLNVGEAMEQSIRDSERMRDGMPALFHRRNRKPWLVTMRLVDWLKLYRTEGEQRKNLVEAHEIRYPEATRNQDREPVAMPQEQRSKRERS